MFINLEQLIILNYYHNSYYVYTVFIVFIVIHNTIISRYYKIS